MELTIEHLAAYLPYGLKIIWNDSKDIYGITYENEADYQKKMYPLSTLIFTMGRRGDLEWKPILLPLSELSYFTNGLKHIGYKIEKDDIENIISDIKQGKAEYDIMQMCFKEHIDVFSLIPANLAIDKNKINK